MNRGTTAVFCRGVAVLATLSIAHGLWAARVEAQACAGDCDGSGDVSIVELVLGVSMALDENGSNRCSAVDARSDGAVTIDELVRAVSGALTGCAAPRARAASSTGPVIVEVGQAFGLPGETAPFTVTLRAPNDLVAGVDVSIAFSPLAPVAANAFDDPDCVRNPVINKEFTPFIFLPSGCTPGVDCTGMRALVLSFTNVDPIPDGSALFT